MRRAASVGALFVVASRPSSRTPSTGHFCDRSGDAYIDIFSCKDFQAELAVEVVRAAFRPEHINFITLARYAIQPRRHARAAAE